MKYGQIWMKKYAERSKAKKKYIKLKEGLKSSILGLKTWGQGGPRAPRAPSPPGSASDMTVTPKGVNPNKPKFLQWETICWIKFLFDLADVLLKNVPWTTSNHSLKQSIAFHVFDKFNLVCLFAKRFDHNSVQEVSISGPEQWTKWPVSNSAIKVPQKYKLNDKFQRSLRQCVGCIVKIMIHKI